jgi:hydrophobe/amphiphile efflux-3 (HAE3) family protein
MSPVFSGIAGWVVRHARIVLVTTVLLAVGACVGAARLSTDAGTGTLVDTDTEVYRATERVREVFGEEPVVVLAQGDLQQLILTPNLGRLLRLEGCLSGKVPKGARPIPGPCAELAAMDPVQFVVGPATFLNEAVIQIDEQLRRLAATVPPDQLREFLLQVAARYGITSAPSIGNPDFLAAVVFDINRSRGTPKAKLSYLFPNNHSTQIILRLRPDLSEGERRHALDLIRAAVYDATPRHACTYKGQPQACFALHGGTYTISGAPVVIEGLAGALKDALLILFAVALLVMALTLLAVFRSRRRLLPLVVALAAAAITFGLLRLLGGSLTAASIAVLPILIGLVVDYAIQLQARFDEAVADGATGVEAVRQAAARGGPTIATACLATTAGFLALQLSPVPMIRSFGWLLIVGIAIGFGLALTAGFAALSLRPPAAGTGAPDARGVLFFALSPWRGKTHRARRKTQQAEGHPSLPPEQRLLGLALAHPRRVLAIGAVLALIGWGVGTQIGTATDIRDLAPQGAGAVQDLNRVQDVTGVSGQLEVSVEAPDFTNPATIRWMAGFKQRVLDSGGFSGPRPSCLTAEVCPGPALSDFLVSGKGHERLRQRDIRATLAELPAYDLEQVAPVDPKTALPGHLALLSFGIRAQSLEDQQALIDRVRGEIGEPGAPGGPPAGVKVRLAGLPVIAAAAASDLSSSRYWLTLAGLVAVALVLLVVYRSWRRSLLPLVPVVMATGWSALVLWLSRIPLNPMSAALGALTIAIATEFSVILTARFHEERGRGLGVAEALRGAYSRTGPAVLASAVTVIAGFAVLIASDVPMLRDFGFVTVIDLVVALLGVMVALPAALAWSEEG